MIKKLLLIFSFIVLVTIAFSGTTYAAQTGETIVISEELSKLNKLYIEGVITEEEFSKAKSILLNPDTGLSEKKKKVVIFKTQKLTAAERKKLEDELREAEIALKEQLRAEKRAEREAEIALKEQLRAEKRAERESIKQARLDEKKRIKAEKEQACAKDPKGKGCKLAKLKLTKILEKIKIKSIENSEKAKAERALEQKAIEERKERLRKERELKKQASLEEQEIIKAEKAARKAERKRLKAEWKKACSDDPESKACKEGKPSEKIKNVLKKIEKKLGG